MSCVPAAAKTPAHHLTTEAPQSAPARHDYQQIGPWDDGSLTFALSGLLAHSHRLPLLGLPLRLGVVAWPIVLLATTAGNEYHQRPARQTGRIRCRERALECFHAR